MAVIAKLNPIIRGWAAYYRAVVSSEAFAALDSHVWRLVYKWAKHTHSSKRWIVDRYFGKHNKFRNDRWVFGDRDSGAHLTRHSWTGIVRNTLVKGGASPDDPALAEYWVTRRKKVAEPEAYFGQDERLEPFISDLYHGRGTVRNGAWAITRNHHHPRSERHLSPFPNPCHHLIRGFGSETTKEDRDIADG
jgi:hypothetical protein